MEGVHGMVANVMRMVRGAWWTAGLVGALALVACRGTSDEVKRDAALPTAETSSRAEQGADEGASGPEAGTPVEQLPSRSVGLEDAGGAARCPQGQYRCCDGSCSEHKGCPGIACDPRPSPPSFRE
ncbi:hypothetical protein LY474_04210 [Myxococcus stipitatus]|uniref:hypothetical protein n=1 Tax=Myxococcus stipitatus TaxID=83455 RepID=UPI001F15ECEB|nr:hypothetical protein [Myxococcus stipitatus]MCE9667011.1 hypothetical protein [Myxococcus stipitatus]